MAIYRPEGILPERRRRLELRTKTQAPAEEIDDDSQNLVHPDIGMKS